MLCPWLSKNLSLHFVTLLTAPIVINSHILAGIYLIFLKNVLDQTWGSFKTEFGPRQKYRKKSYQVKQNLALFRNLVALILGWYCVKGLIVVKFIAEIGFKGAWSKLRAKNIPRDNIY